eukprot:TRINITY_DN6898_c0_g1_i6.p1 TRINITY_DN6898_c0_g1~~TRINITY_DN6898_c0_g1_i6.p1  ORF type:complete len:159 (-),score=7.85 TRINITY_DN6898_c0_g1_i6:193-669(-)
MSDLFNRVQSNKYMLMLVILLGGGNINYSVNFPEFFSYKEIVPTLLIRQLRMKRQLEVKSSFHRHEEFQDAIDLTQEAIIGLHILPTLCCTSSKFVDDDYELYAMDRVVIETCLWMRMPIDCPLELIVAYFQEERRKMDSHSGEALEHILSRSLAIEL